MVWNTLRSKSDPHSDRSVCLQTCWFPGGGEHQEQQGVYGEDWVLTGTEQRSLDDLPWQPSGRWLFSRRRKATHCVCVRFDQHNPVIIITSAALQPLFLILLPDICICNPAARRQAETRPPHHGAGLDEDEDVSSVKKQLFVRLHELTSARHQPHQHHQPHRRLPSVKVSDGRTIRADPSGENFLDCLGELPPKLNLNLKCLVHVMYFMIYF